MKQITVNYVQTVELVDTDIRLVNPPGLGRRAFVEYKGSIKIPLLTTTTTTTTLFQYSHFYTGY